MFDHLSQIIGQFGIAVGVKTWAVAVIAHVDGNDTTCIA